MNTWSSEKESEFRLPVLIGPRYRAGSIVFRDLVISSEFNHKFLIACK